VGRDDWIIWELKNRKLDFKTQSTKLKKKKKKENSAFPLNELRLKVGI
jgi:hypothetical protein